MMESFAPLPEDLFDDNLRDDNNNAYLSLAQFDVGLQQQAQAALQQGAWQDFDNFLPVDYHPMFLSNQPITPPSTHIPYGPDSTFIYDTKKQQQQQQLPTDLNTTNTTNTTNTWPEPVIVKQEQHSPETGLLDCQPQFTTVFPDSSYFDPSQPLLDFLPLDPTADLFAQPTFNLGDSVLVGREKVPIQRLKTANSPSGNTTPVLPGGGRQLKKTAHNAIERRYRNNINDRIAELKNAVPALLHAKPKDTRTGKRAHRSIDDDDDDGEDSEEFLDGVAVATKLNKATILRKATEYILHLKKSGEDMKRENATLQHILAQMQGGPEVLVRYRQQKMQREQEALHQQIVDRQVLKQQQQQRKAASRKRSRQQSSAFDTHDEYESSASSTGSDPLTPPAISNRVYMAVFMALTFFSTSPLTSGPNASEQYQNHHHRSRTAGLDQQQQQQQQDINIESTSANFFVADFWPTDLWSVLRTTVFVICLVQLLMPILKATFSPSFKLRRVPSATNRSRRAARQRSSVATNNNTAGQIRVVQIHDMLIRSLEETNDSPPQSTLGLVLGFSKELTRLVFRHAFGYEIFYTPQPLVQEWSSLLRWIKLNEVLCLGGNPGCGSLMMLYSCLRMVNQMDVFEDEDEEDEDEGSGGISAADLQASRARVYCTAAMQMSLLVPKQSLARTLSNHFYSLALEESDQTTAPMWVKALADWEDEDEEIQDTRAWSETLTVLSTQRNPTSNTLSLSLTAPVLVPVVLLSTLHMLDALQSQFHRLAVVMTASEVREEDSQIFADFLDLTAENNNSSKQQPHDRDDQLRIVQWLAAVGGTVEALWSTNEKTRKADIEHAYSLLSTLIVRQIPRAVTAESNLESKTRANEIDEIMKSAICHTLSGAIMIKNQQIEAGHSELVKGERLRASARKLVRHTKEAKRNGGRSKQEEYSNTNAKNAKDNVGAVGGGSGGSVSIEHSALVVADFVVALVGLEAWIKVWKTGEKEDAGEQVRDLTLVLRRMISQPSLKLLQSNQSLIIRLSRLNRYVAHPSDETDSACDMSDLEEEEEEEEEESELSSEGEVSKRADRALDILHGPV
ncbi:helix-loop-helix DNA-binding domain-containing transcription factor [Phycomyces blakesleeanus]